jgi:hypothetical protein
MGGKMNDQDNRLNEARGRRGRILEERTEKARSILRNYYNYDPKGPINLLTAFVDLLIDVFHLARRDQQNINLDLAVALAKDLYHLEVPEAVEISEKAESAGETGPTSG